MSDHPDVLSISPFPFSVRPYTARSIQFPTSRLFFIPNLSRIFPKRALSRSRWTRMLLQAHCRNSSAIAVGKRTACDRLEQLVAAEYQARHTVGIIDETSDPEKGDKTPGVQKQWYGRLGKTENCIVTVHLSFAREDFHCLLDGELYLPESWAPIETASARPAIPTP